MPARAAIAGNPSDLYGGAVVAVPVASLAAQVELEEAAITTVEPENALVRATLERHGAVARVRWATDIPALGRFGGIERAGAGHSARRG